MMLELRRISASYDGHPVLRDVDLVVPAHSVVALLGPNGAGKTTLLRVASGLLRPDEGQILLDGLDVTGFAADRLAKSGVCHVPEGRGVFGALSVRDNLRLQGKPGADRHAIVAAAEAFPRLGERLGQLAGTLSGGEQQMLAIARTYVANARLALLDEVSIGLAPLIVDEIFASLHSLARAGTAMLVVEQYVAKALEFADYAYILNKGRIQFVGEPDEVGEEQILASYLGASA
jgi:branched-chain amino acid transport system ATP-binding protein